MAKKKSRQTSRASGRAANPAAKQRGRAAGPTPTPTRAKSARAAASASPHTPLIRASLAVSLDGYIADKDGGVDWLNRYFSPEIDFAGFMKTIGISVMGRVTYDWSAAHGRAGQLGSRCIVITHRPIENAPPGVESFAGDSRELADRLRLELAGTGKDIWHMGGGRSIAAFHAMGLIDRWELAIIPIVLGDGIPLFPKHSRGFEDLKLTYNRVLTNGIVEVWYEPQRPVGPV